MSPFNALAAPRSLAAVILAAILMIFGAVLLSPSPAHAHDGLVSSDPADGATVDALPSELTLTFSGELSTFENATEVEVTDAAGTSLASGGPVTDGTTVTQALAGEATGTILVVWKVVSSDTHAIDGTYTFTVTAPAPTPTPTPSATVSSAPTESPSATETAVPVTDEDADSDDAWPWIAGALILVAIAGAVTYLLVSSARRKRALEAATTLPPAPSDEGSSASADR